MTASRRIDNPAAPCEVDDARFAALDLLSTMVAIVTPEGECIFANTSFENALGLSRRSMSRGSIFDWFVDAASLRDAVAAVSGNAFATSRLEAQLKRPVGSPGEALPGRVAVNQIDASRNVVFEFVEVEQQTRQQREERALEQAQATKELIRNLAHEIKNPLGGIRGAAQLLEMEIESRTLTEYTQVIINEADRLQALVDRLLAPHRKPHVVTALNIHEVCERVHALILAEFPNGLAIERDYDASIPEMSGDREQLIQAVLNIVHNAAEALAPRIEAGDARICACARGWRSAVHASASQRFRLALELHIEDNGPGVRRVDMRETGVLSPAGIGQGRGLGTRLDAWRRPSCSSTTASIECESLPGRTVFKVLIPLP